MYSTFSSACHRVHLTSRNQLWRFPRFHFPQVVLEVMSRAAQTYILNKLHLECQPYLIPAALIGFNRVYDLGPASLRGYDSLMNFICMLHSCVWPVGTGSLRRHLSLSKHMDIGFWADIHTYWCWMTQQGQSIHTAHSLNVQISFCVLVINYDSLFVSLDDSVTIVRPFYSYYQNHIHPIRGLYCNKHIIPLSSMCTLRHCSRTNWATDLLSLR